MPKLPGFLNRPKIFRNVIFFLSLFIALSAECFADDNHASLRAYPNATISAKDPATKTVVFVEGTGRYLVAINAQDGSFLWSKNIIGLHTPEVGEPVIRRLEIKNGKIRVIAGKQCVYDVDLKTGTAKFVGCD
jgi:hypothetical protein